VIGSLQHVALRVADVREASGRWAAQFGLTERGPGLLSCDDEPCALELIAAEGAGPGFDHVAWGLRRDVSLDDAAARLDGLRVAHTRVGDERIELEDLEGNLLHLLPHREPASRLVAHARPADRQPLGHPRKLGHVNFLTGRIAEQKDFYVDVLGMRLTDWLGDGGVWLSINSEHHVMALVAPDPPTPSHFHHLALDTVDIGQMRDTLDHLGRHGRWLGWGPTRHGVGGNIASYVRIVEEECFVELYCDMEQLAADHEPRVWPDDRYSSNTWGPLPPRSYFRFDPAAVESERESLEAQGIPLPPAPTNEEINA
jgi:catechol 2,3-dioxygenase-like lactoylglutathione lyase family enzyme